MAKYFFFIFKATKFQILSKYLLSEVLLKSKSIRSAPDYKDAKDMLEEMI